MSKIEGTGVGSGHGGNTANMPMIHKMARRPFDQFLEPGAETFKAGKLIAIRAQHPETGAWYLSISRPDRYPSWDEIAYLRYALIPEDAVMAMLLPKKSVYVNVHNYCFHLHQLPPEDWHYTGADGADQIR